MNHHHRELITNAAEGLPRRRFTVAELEQMTAAGIIEEDERIAARQNHPEQQVDAHRRTAPVARLPADQQHND